jgi:ribosomal protein S18 acetylase RimI-like enzyme
MTTRRTHAVRRAVADDADALTRLRAQMLSDMRRQHEGSDPRWHGVTAEWFARRLRDGQDFAAFVIDEPDLGVVSCAVGVCDDHAPTPGNLSGVHGHVFNMSTDPRFRRLGYARSCLEALLTWFRDETPALVVKLNATDDGIALYRSLGFTEPGNTALQLKLDKDLR